MFLGVDRDDVKDIVWRLEQIGIILLSKLFSELLDFLFYFIFALTDYSFSSKFRLLLLILSLLEPSLGCAIGAATQAYEDFAFRGGGGG